MNLRDKLPVKTGVGIASISKVAGLTFVDSASSLLKLLKSKRKLR